MKPGIDFWLEITIDPSSPVGAGEHRICAFHDGQPIEHALELLQSFFADRVFAEQDRDSTNYSRLYRIAV